MKPTVKWHDMSSTIFALKKCKRSTTKKNDNSDVDDDFADDSDVNKDGEESDNEEPEDDGDDSSGTVDDVQGESFDISPTIDLKSTNLADVLSEKDSLPRKATVKKAQLPVTAPQKVLSKEDWEM